MVQYFFTVYLSNLIDFSISSFKRIFFCYYDYRCPFTSVNQQQQSYIYPLINFSLSYFSGVFVEIQKICEWAGRFATGESEKASNRARVYPGGTQGLTWIRVFCFVTHMRFRYSFILNGNVILPQSFECTIHSSVSFWNIRIPYFCYMP